MTLAEMLAAIQKRAFTGSGIGTAAGYVQTVLSAAEADGFCRQFPGKSAKDLAALIKNAGETLVYRPPGETLTSVTRIKKGGTEFVTFGTPARKDAGKLTSNSVMDFENILTTKGQDRDGDILHPKGGKVDPSAPLLWQHIPTEPIGKLIQVVEQNDEFIKTHCAIAETPLGVLSAKLVEFGALRISHGFKPVKWKALSDGDDGGMIKGWEVEEFEVMEISLVSVPANVGAVITAYQKDRKSFDACPLAKLWAEKLWEERPAMVRSGFGGNWKKTGSGRVVVNVNVGGKKSKKDDDPKPEDEDKKPKKEDDPKPTGDGADPDGKAGNVLSDIAQRAQDMADDETLSNEVRARCSVVAGILADVGAGITTAMDQISQCAQAQDLAGLVAAQQELTTNCGKRLQRAAAELASLLQTDDLEESAAGAVQEMAESIGASLSGIMPAGQDQDGSEGGTGDWVQLDGEGEEDKDEDESDDGDDEGDDEEEEEKDEEETDDADEESDDDGDDEDEEEEDKEDESDEEKDDADGSVDTGVDPSKDGDDEREDGDEEDEEDESEEKSDDDDDDDEKDLDDDETEEKEGGDDEDEEPAPKSKPKKPKATDLNAMAKRLTAEAMSGGPIKLKDHRQLAGLIVAGGAIDPNTLLMYRQVCGAVLKKAAR